MNANTTGSSVMTRKSSLSTYQFQRERERLVCVCLCMCVCVCMHTNTCEKNHLGQITGYLDPEVRRGLGRGAGPGYQERQLGMPFPAGLCQTDNQIGPRSPVEWGNMLPG